MNPILLAHDRAKQDGFVHLAQALAEMYRQQLQPGLRSKQSCRSESHQETFVLKEPMVYED